MKDLRCYPRRLARWCNGSTADSESVCHGSNPCRATKSFCFVSSHPCRDAVLFHIGIEVAFAFDSASPKTKLFYLLHVQRPTLVGRSSRRFCPTHTFFITGKHPFQPAINLWPIFERRFHLKKKNLSSLEPYQT